jgi:hypothetical protein
VLTRSANDARVLNHDRLFAPLDRTLPSVMRDHARQDIDASRETAFDQRAAGLFRLDSGRVCRIDETMRSIPLLPPHRTKMPLGTAGRQ